MDAAFYLSILREHAQYLRKLSTDLSDKFEQLEKELGEQQSPHEPATDHALTGMKELNEAFFATADMFHRRVHEFLIDPPLRLR